MTLQTGTYVREPDGATLLYHSDTRWNCPVQGLQANREVAPGSIWHWRRVDGEEAEEVHRRYHLSAGEYAECYEGGTRTAANERRANRATLALDRAGDDYPPDREEAAVDLMADVLLMLDLWYGIEPEDALRSAWHQFRAAREEGVMT